MHDFYCNYNYNLRRQIKWTELNWWTGLHSSHPRGKREDERQLAEGEYLVRNVYYRHKNYNDFCRTVTTISDCTGEELQVGMIEYHIKDEEHSSSPHKHPRTGKSFVPTAPSTKSQIAEKTKRKSHKDPTSILWWRGGSDWRHFELWSHGRHAKRHKASQKRTSKFEGEDWPGPICKPPLSHKARAEWTPFPRVVFCTYEPPYLWTTGKNWRRVLLVGLQKCPSFLHNIQHRRFLHDVHYFPE